MGGDGWHNLIINRYGIRGDNLAVPSEEVAYPESRFEHEWHRWLNGFVPHMCGENTVGHCISGA